MELPNDLKTAVRALSALPEVEAILLSGSRGRTGIVDSRSDYDLYVYVSSIPPTSVRDSILRPLSQSLELDNRFWEVEDDGVFNDSTAFEFIYRNVFEFETNLEKDTLVPRASVGYSTCFWANVRNSVVVFDRSGRGRGLVEKAERPLTDDHVRAIVEKNWPLLFESSSAFGRQVEKAQSRRDWISVQHRCAGFFASYFDILFAVNRVLHPGEKKLSEEAIKLLRRLPESFEKDLENVRSSLQSDQTYLVGHLKTMTNRLGALLAEASWIEVRPPQTFEFDFSSPQRNSEAAEIVVYTDGGCIGNPGKGAWATVVAKGEERFELCGGDPATTNNKMELKAVIEALKAVSLKVEWKGIGVSVYTDSQYVKNGITTWIATWERNGWKTAAKESVKNQDLWKELQTYDRLVQPQWKWVKGHAGNAGNERCDALVRETMQSLP